MKRAALTIVALIASASMVGTAAAAIGTPASLAVNVAATAVGHHHRAVFVTPLYGPRVIVAPPAVVPSPYIVPAPVAAPARVVVPRLLYYRPLYRPFWGGVHIETPRFSLGIGY